MQSSTVRSALDPTIAGSTTDDRSAILAESLIAQWGQSGQPDMVVTLRQHPQLLRKRSLLLNLAIAEYKARRRSAGDLDLEKHCDRFQEFGSSIQRSIQRQLEVQRFVDEQPELLEDLDGANWLEAGATFAGFHILEELGVGATARVYLCREAAVGNRPVVVKVTPFPSVEASVLGRLNHQHIIPIHSADFVDDYDLHYVCMPYCGRSTLLDLLDVAYQDGCPRTDHCIAIAADRWTSDDNRLPRREKRRQFIEHCRYGTYVDGILNLAIQIAEALDHAHQQGILHGDLKPSNVLLTPSGRPLLLDFNLSRDYASTPRICGGTLPYMPPEHLQVVAGDLPQGDNVRSDVTSDIYSYGALLFELLAGVTPVRKLGDACDSSTMAKRLLARIQQGVGSIRQHNPLVSRRLESIVLRCLAIDRQARPTTMAEVKRILQSERRSFAAVGRQARVRPVLFSVAVGLPLAILSGGVAYVAVQPAQYLADFEAGSQLAAKGQQEKAAEYFASAVDDNPSYAPARFELGRARIALGELDLALNEFGQLARSEGDAQSLAYFAYCFNLKRISVAAIPWYERAIKSGAASTAVYNNLGASYIDASNHLPRKEQLSRAERYLHQALASGDASSVVQLNIVRHAIAKSQSDSSYNPFDVWRQVEFIIASRPKDRFVETHVALWYHEVLDHEKANPTLRSDSGSHLSKQELAGRTQFAAIYERVRSSNENFPIVFEATSEPSFPIGRYFLEPVLPNAAKDVARYSK